MLNEIKSNLDMGLSTQPDSRCASADEVRIAWLVAEVEKLQATHLIPPHSASSAADGNICPNRAPVCDIRKALEVVEEFKKAGIAFVPIPTLNEQDGLSLQKQCFDRLVLLDKAVNHGEV